MPAKLPRFRFGYPKSQWWSLRFRPAGEIAKWRRGTHGYCDSDARTLCISDVVTGKKLLETAIHEGLHAELWALDEEAVAQTAKRLAALVWHLRGKWLL